MVLTLVRSFIHRCHHRIFFRW